MKQPKMRSIILGAGLSLILFSCGNNESSTTESAETDSTSMATTDSAMTTPAAPAAAANYEVNPPYNLMVVTHKVANYDKWKTSYDKHDSVRTAFGMHSYVIARMLPDSNTLLVAVKADDMDKATAFSKSPNLKAAMKDGGVVGTPEMHMYKVVYDATNTIPTDTRVIRNITVKDWDAWKKSFESHRQTRTDNGLTDRAYGYDVDDNHKVTLVVAINDTAKAYAFWKSDLLKQQRAEGGVVGEVKRHVYRVVQKY